MNWLQDMLKTSVLAMLFLLSSVVVAVDKQDGPAPALVTGTTFIDTATAQLLQADGIPFVDVRPASMYQSGRIPGAISLPLPGGKFNQQALARVVSPDDPVVLHCRGINCMMSSMAAKMAVKWGYSQIYYYRVGYNGWKEAGQPVEVPTKGIKQVKN